MDDSLSTNSETLVYGWRGESGMTVRELIEELQDRDQDALVWVPLCTDGKNGLAKYVCRCPHTNLPEGIAISDDIAILPIEMADYVHGDDGPNMENPG